MKTGRNDPCPCGSGKKYKKCCLPIDRQRRIDAFKIDPGDENEDEYFEDDIINYPDFFEENGPNILDQAFEKHISTLREEVSNKSIIHIWTPDCLREMHTEDILAKLEEINVHFDEGEFRKQGGEYILVDELVDEKYRSQPHTADRYDEDFIWCAINELWYRLMPDKFNLDMAFSAIHDGFDANEEMEPKKAIDLWNRAWMIIMSILPEEFTSIEIIDEKYGTPFDCDMIIWIDDYMTELANVEDLGEAILNQRIKVCNEFCERFPESANDMIPKMLLNEAESYGMLGDVRKAEKCFKELISKYPTWYQGYLSVGKYYCSRWESGKGEKDVETVKKILKDGIRRCKRDKKELIEMIKFLDQIDEE